MKKNFVISVRVPLSLFKFYKTVSEECGVKIGSYVYAVLNDYFASGKRIKVSKVLMKDVYKNLARKRVS